MIPLHHVRPRLTSSPRPARLGSSPGPGGMARGGKELFITKSSSWAREIFLDSPLDMHDNLCYISGISFWGCPVGGVKRVNAELVSEAVRLYEGELLNFREIGERLGVTRQCAYLWVRKAGGCETHAMDMSAECANCGEPYKTSRQQIKAGRKFCSRPCYFAATSLYGEYSRQGQRQGRKVAEAQEGEVVHHIDGNTFNNAEGNLIVFCSNAQHMSFHKSGAAAWLKDKVARRQVVLTEVTHWPDGGKW